MAVSKINNIDITNNKFQSSNLLFNPKNIYITLQDVYNIFSTYNIYYKLNPKSINTIQQAFVNSSYCSKDVNNNLIHNPNNYMQLFNSSNERLEFLGDNILKAIIGNYLFLSYPNADEGILTKFKFKLEDKNTYSQFSKKLYLDRFVIISKSLEDEGKRFHKSILEDTFEAFVGALYLECGYDLVYNLMVNIINKEFDFRLLSIDTNYKAQLTYFCHEKKYKLPTYVDIKTNKNYFIVGVNDLTTNNGSFIAFGKGFTKLNAQQDCAYQVLKYYGKL